MTTLGNTEDLTDNGKDILATREKGAFLLNERR